MAQLLCKNRCILSDCNLLILQLRHWLATAGRDRTVRVWKLDDLAYNSNSIKRNSKLNEYAEFHQKSPPGKKEALATKQVPVDTTIGTIAPAGKVKWRPDRRSFLSSSSMAMDFSINIWDINRLTLIS